MMEMHRFSLLSLVIILVTAIILILSSCTSSSGFSKNDLGLKELETHLRFIASDELKGRKPGTYGADVSARYIAEQFRGAGLRMFSGEKDYFQSAELLITDEDNGVSTKITSSNVIGYIEGTDPKLKHEYVLLCAHYDHLGTKEGEGPDEDIIYNGARDNGIGTVALISAARIISRYPPRRSIIFIAFTGEEEGMLGSKFFIEHPVLDLDGIVYVINNDGGGFNDTTNIRVAGLDETSIKSLILESSSIWNLECFDYPENLEYLINLSDIGPFAEIGIPAITVSPGFDKIDEEILKYVHTVEDEADDDFNYSYLLNFTNAYIEIALAIANTEIELRPE